MLLTRFDAAALVPVLQGRQYLLVHVERASDILQVLALKRDFPLLKIVLVGASEGWTGGRPDRPRRRPGDRFGGRTISRRASNNRGDPVEHRPDARRRESKVSIGMIDDNDTRNLFMERQYAGNLVGLTEDPGRNGGQLGRSAGDDHVGPAQAIGMGGEIGSLAPGRRADVVIWSGDPLEGTSAAEQVYIDGVRQPLETHQTRLLQRYRYLPRRDLPEAYRR